MLKNHDLQLTQRYIMVPSLVGHGLIEICDETMESSLGRMYRMTTCKVCFFFLNKHLFCLFTSGCLGFWLQHSAGPSLRLSSCGAQALLLRNMWDLPSPTRDQTLVPCIGRQICNRWTTREVPTCKDFVFYITNSIDLDLRLLELGLLFLHSL